MESLTIVFFLMLAQGIKTHAVNNIEERVDHLEAILKHQAGLITFMEKANLHQGKEIERLKDQAGQIDSMEKLINAQQEEIKELKTQARRIHFWEEQIGSQQHQITQLTEQLNDIRDVRNFQNGKLSEVTYSEFGLKGVASANKDVKDTKRQEPEPKGPSSQNCVSSKRALTTTTAFYAYMSKNEPAPGKHHTLIFDTVKTNENNGYSQHTGVFTVPSAGTYVFTFSIRLYSNNVASFEIIKNSDVVGAFINEHNNDSEQDTVTGIVVIRVNNGDVVYVRTHATYIINGDIYSNTNGRSSFSGWLI